MSNRRSIWGVKVPGTAILIVLGVAGAVAAGHRSQPPAPVKTAASQIVLDAGAGETFTPTASAPTTIPVISEAAARTSAGTNAFTPPGDAVAQMGYFTFPVGPGDPDKYLAKDQLSYAFHWKSCAPNVGRVPMQGASSAPTQAPMCTMWVIIDATSGAVLDTTWTQ
ncbi:hypothetical protein GCM10028801_04680 [Nocardioides maradonensis]